MIDNEQHYFCAKDDDGSISIKVDNELDKVVLWATGEGETDERTDTDKPSLEGQEPANNDSNSFRDLLYKINKNTYQQSEAIYLVNMVGQAFPTIYLNNNIVNHIKESREVAHDGGTYQIYRIEKQDIPVVLEEAEKIQTVSHGLAQLPSAILLSLVGVFDSQMSDIVRTMLRSNTEKLSNSEKTLPLSRVMSAESIEALINDAVNDEVYQFSRNSHDEQIAYIAKHFAVDIKKDWARWADFIEIFERRNLVAHGETKFTKRYVETCKLHGHKGAESLLNKDTLVTISYLKQCRDVLTECALLTAFSLWRKHIKDEEPQSFNTMLEIVFDAISKRHYILAVHLCEYVLSLKNTSAKAAIRLRFVVNLASAKMHLKHETSALSILDKEDWSATSDDFRICVAALRKNVKEVCEIMPLFKASRKIDANEFRSWPVFNFIKDEEDFRAAFKSVFGEEYIVSDFRKASKKIAPVDAETSTSTAESDPSDSGAAIIH